MCRLKYSTIWTRRIGFRRRLRRRKRNSKPYGTRANHDSGIEQSGVFAGLIREDSTGNEGVIPKPREGAIEPVEPDQKGIWSKGEFKSPSSQRNPEVVGSNPTPTMEQGYEWKIPNL
jgi:hypothetical protein